MKYASCALALLLCIILDFSSCYDQGIFFREIEILKDYFNSSSSDVADGKPLFVDILKNWKEESDKKVIQSQIISFYFKLFDNLKDNQIIQRSMDTIKEELFIRFFNSSTNKLNDFINVTQLPVNDVLVQRKAMSELIKVMNDLSPRSTLRKQKRSRCCFGLAGHKNKAHPARSF
ncbi:interferon gamma [Perognathus longimembris pacificus]|uniref:interferon gamma n=1 Tax=Perognathus longimembris pacificus TaxID=214514 RepID=UPI002019E1C6|nr:interferon gamma [Perognathus longimembris pacificus]